VRIFPGGLQPRLRGRLGEVLVQETGFIVNGGRLTPVSTNSGQVHTAGLRARMPRRFRRTTDSGHALVIRDNLLARRFAVAQANFVWVADITYLWTPVGWLCLAVILDLFSRRVVGWSMSERLEKKLALDALSMALAERQPQGGLLHHSDRGSQYASHEYQELLASHGLLSSMSRTGNCWDNAVAESFFATLKTELAYQIRWSTRAQARSDVFEYIEVFYNRRRRHSALGYRCPDEFERAHQRKLAA
jgi:putative transposase